jgi:TolB-like protein/class 3 adenylate cyclase
MGVKHALRTWRVYSGRDMVEEDGKQIASHPPKVRRRSERRLAAILGIDIKGYTILMAGDEEKSHRRVGSEIDRLVREIEKAQGRVFSFAGDGLMADFPSAVEAMRCALRIQADASRRNLRLPPDRRIEYRIGLNAGEIVDQAGRTGGHAVNVAARLQQIAEPGGIWLSRTIFDQVSHAVPAEFEPIGERRLKNMRSPVMVYRISPEACRSWTSTPARGSTSVGTVAEATAEYRPSLAVLPFRTLQEDQADAWFAEGMVDDIIRVLGGLKELLVIARSSTLGFARSPLDLRRVGQELDVRYVLHGSVRRSGAMLRISVELADAESGHVIWADRFDGDLSDLFNLQDRIAVRVVSIIAPHVRELELNRAMRKHPGSMTAYDLTLEALDLLYRLDRESFVRSHELLRTAVAHDPAYAPAWSYTAYWHLVNVGQGWSSDTAADAVDAANAAASTMRLDRNDALALSIYGHVQSYLMKDYAKARDILDSALLAGPNCALAWSMSAFTYEYLGQGAKAIADAEQAVRLSPLGPDAYWHEHSLAQAHYVSGNYEDAIAWGQVSSTHNGAFTSSLRCLVASHVAAGNLTAAREMTERLMQLSPGFRLDEFATRTPLTGEIRDTFIERLRASGVPD